VLFAAFVDIEFDSRSGVTTACLHVSLDERAEINRVCDHIADVRGQWRHEMAAELAPRHAYVANDAADTSAWNEHAFALCPDPVEFAQKRLVVLDPAKLALHARIFFKCPVGRGSDDQVHRAVGDCRKIACVAQRYRVRGGIEWTRPGGCRKRLITARYICKASAVLSASAARSPREDLNHIARPCWTRNCRR
jgi:hypothetical protein